MDERDRDARLTELELRYTEQQRLLQELSDVLYAQQRALEKLQSEVASSRQKLAALDELPAVGPAEKPPHY